MLSKSRYPFRSHTLSAICALSKGEGAAGSAASSVPGRATGAAGRSPHADADRFRRPATAGTASQFVGNLELCLPHMRCPSTYWNGLSFRRQGVSGSGLGRMRDRSVSRHKATIFSAEMFPRLCSASVKNRERQEKWLRLALAED